MITAVAADDLEQVRVPAFGPAANNAGRLAAQNHRPAVPELITGRHARLLQRRLRQAPPPGCATRGPAASTASSSASRGAGEVPELPELSQTPATRTLDHLVRVRFLVPPGLLTSGRHQLASHQ